MHSCRFGMNEGSNAQTTSLAVRAIFDALRGSATVEHQAAYVANNGQSQRRHDRGVGHQLHAGMSSGVR